MRIQLVDLAFHSPAGELLSPSPFICQEVEIIGAWFKLSQGEHILMPAQVYWDEGAEYIRSYSGCYVVITDTDTGKSVLEGKQTDKELRYLSDSDVLFEVLPFRDEHASVAAERSVGTC